MEDRACTETLLRSKDILCKHVSHEFRNVFRYLNESSQFCSEDIVTSPNSSTKYMEWLIETLASKDMKAFNDFLDALSKNGYEKVGNDLKSRMEETLTNLVVDEGSEDIEEEKNKNKTCLLTRLLSMLIQGMNFLVHQILVLIIFIGLYIKNIEKCG